MVKFNVDIDTILDLKLGFEAYFVLYCVFNKNEELITGYTRTCKKINTEIFNQLEEQDYIEIDKTGLEGTTIYFKRLSMTDKGNVLFGPLESLKERQRALFNDFRSNYLAITKKGRRLHTNLTKSQEYYVKITKEVSHETLCKCARLYIKEKERTDSLEFTQMLVTWLHQKNYELYVDLPEEESVETGNLDAI